METGAGEQTRLYCPLGATLSGLNLQRDARHRRSRSNRTLHHRRWGREDTIRERAMLRPQPAAYPASRVALWPLSYRRMERRAGFEPATSRLSVEVTAIFTTDRDGVGGERSMLLLPLRAIRLSARRSRTCSALSRLYHEVTDIFTTARPMLSHQPLKDTLGNGRYRLSVTTTQAPSLRMDPAPGRVQTFSEAASRCVCQRREAYPLCRVEKYPTSSPPASVEPRSSRQTNFKKILLRRCRRAAYCEPFGFALPSVSGSSPRSLRQAPRTWTRASPARAPGSGSPVPANAGMFEWAARRATKNPPERQAREGP